MRRIIPPIQAYKDQGYKSMIIWTLEKNKDRVFYDKMGGVLTEKKTHPLANEELPMVGFVWEDIRRI